MFGFDVGEDERLRLLEESDAAELYALIEADRAYLSEWMPWAPAQTLEDTRVFIRRARKQLGDNDGFQTAIVLDGRIVGEIGYHRVDWHHRSTSIGYWLASSAQGRGAMTRAVRALVDWAFRGVGAQPGGGPRGARERP